MDAAAIVAADPTWTESEIVDRVVALVAKSLDERTGVSGKPVSRGPLEHRSRAATARNSTGKN
jgi:hypothetical protein